MKLLLFPTFAATDIQHENAWCIPVNGVCLKSKTKRLQRKVLVNLLRRLTDVPAEALDSALCQERMAPFFAAPSRKKKIQLLIDQNPIATVRKTRRNGQFRAKLLLKESELSDSLNETQQFELMARQVETDDIAASMNVRLIPPHGNSVISDIDDTIKFSNVENRSELLVNTFMREFTAIEGMSSVYQRLAAKDYDFHYVTASPWQLYEPLRAFLNREKYPKGSMHFRTFRISDHLLKKMGLIHRDGKSAAVRRILASFPERKFTLIGDSGEKDVEIYSRCYQQFPDRVEKILIRLIQPEHIYRESVIEGGLNLPPEVFKTFGTADELSEILDCQPGTAKASDIRE